MRSAAGNMQVAVTAAGFTTLFFIIVILAGALAMGYGRRSQGASRPGRDLGPTRGLRPVAGDQWDRGGPPSRGPQSMDTGPIGYPQPGYSPAGGPAAGAPQGGYRTPVRSEFQGGGKFGVSKHKDMLTVEVNPNKCARFGFCEHEAPEVFYLESDGRFGYQATVPVSKMEEVITAMDVCPRRAIKVKIPADYDPLAIMQPQEDPRQETRRTVIPIMGERQPEDEAPRRA